MISEKIMITNVITAYTYDTVEQVLERMRGSKLRMLPVLNEDDTVAGVISTFSIMEKVVPSYIVTGDLNQISFAPDLGILRKHYKEVATLKVAEVMETKPLMVNLKESLLSVAAAMISFTKHEYAIVVDDEKRLHGIISAGDILDRLQISKEGGNDA